MECVRTVRVRDGGARSRRLNYQNPPARGRHRRPRRGHPQCRYFFFLSFFFPQPTGIPCGIRSVHVRSRLVRRRRPTGRIRRSRSRLVRDRRRGGGLLRRAFLDLLLFLADGLKILPTREVHRAHHQREDKREEQRRERVRSHVADVLHGALRLVPERARGHQREEHEEPRDRVRDHLVDLGTDEQRPRARGLRRLRRLENKLLDDREEENDADVDEEREHGRVPPGRVLVETDRSLVVEVRIEDHPRPRRETDDETGEARLAGEPVEVQPAPHRGYGVNRRHRLDREQARDVRLALADVVDGQAQADDEAADGRAEADAFQRGAVLRRVFPNLIRVRLVDVLHEHGAEREQAAVRGGDHRGERGHDEQRRGEVAKVRRRLQLEREVPEDGLLVRDVRDGRRVSQRVHRGPARDHRAELHPEEREVHPGEPALEHLAVLRDEQSHREVREHRRGGGDAHHEGRVRDDGPAPGRRQHRLELPNLVEVVPRLREATELHPGRDEEDEGSDDEHDALDDVRVRDGA
eukprot:30891-Pelagococcus_subviridis.AAC.12